MKRNILLIILFIVQNNFAQNVFPLPSGKVGIGTNTPTVPLDVVGTVKIQSSNGNYDENLRLLPSLTGDYASIALGAVNGNSGTGIGQWTLIRYPAINNYMFSLRYNSTDYFNILNNGYIGIGTTSPTDKLTVAGSTQIDNHILLGHIGNTNKIVSREVNQILTIGGSDITTFETYSSGWSERMRIANNGNVGIGTQNPSNKLDVNGTIHSKEVKVDMNGWSDFVFKKDYALPTLAEVEKQIAENGHLENIPSEEEVLKTGINLGEMNAKLLQKIEELTLYMIEMKKENEKVKDENKLMKENQEELERRILKIENK